jgi:hypothetical protein
MRGRMKQDSTRRPELFSWNGPIAVDDLDDWLNIRRLHVPDDLRELWRDTGGGEMFESESILAPFGSEELGDDVDGVNRLHQDRGLPSGYLIFHVGGVGLSAVRLADQCFVLIEEDGYAERAEFESLEDWYDSAIRAEYVQRYGLGVGADCR